MAKTMIILALGLAAFAVPTAEVRRECYC